MKLKFSYKIIKFNLILFIQFEFLKNIYILRWLQIWICQRRLHSYSTTKMENGEEDTGRHTSKRSEVFQIPASSMRKSWGGIKWLGFPISHRAWTQRLLSHRKMINANPYRFWILWYDDRNFTRFTTTIRKPSYIKAVPPWI